MQSILRSGMESHCDRCLKNETPSCSLVGAYAKRSIWYRTTCHPHRQGQG